MHKPVTNSLHRFARTPGEVNVWITSLGLILGFSMILALIALILVKGLSVFWTAPIATITLKANSGSLLGSEPEVAGEITKIQFKKGLEKDAEPERELQLFVGNRDAYGISFKYIPAAEIAATSYPKDIVLIERMEYGDAIGYIESLRMPDGRVLTPEEPGFSQVFAEAVADAGQRRGVIRKIERKDIGRINAAMNALRLEQRSLEAAGAFTPDQKARIDEAMSDLQKDFDKLAAEARALREKQKESVLSLRLASGQLREIAVGDIVDFVFPNQLDVFQKSLRFFHNFWRFLTEEPREANTEGGIFPAIFGTTVMTLLMSLAVMPFGVVAAIYLREYAKQGPMVRAVRIAVNNLAGVPSIVFGVFGLGFFVYLSGATIDQWFFSESLPTPTFGTGGILWASLTLALMTVPVVIVATEEALAAVPRGMREGSLACGASKWQTIQRVVLPTAAPGILTGLILAMARGAGEVAPLMLVGVVKLAPTLPVDTDFPFIHLERKFMHLAFHIYDLGFQSPDSEAAKPMVFATTLFLILLVVILNLTAIILRERLRKKYATGAF
jgi:phosphate transport system permease protein